MSLFSLLVVQIHHTVYFLESECGVWHGVGKGRSAEINLEDHLQNSCFHKSPAIFIGNTTGNSQDNDGSKSTFDCLLTLESRSEV